MKMIKYAKWYAMVIEKSTNNVLRRVPCGTYDKADQMVEKMEASLGSNDYVYLISLN